MRVIMKNNFVLIKELKPKEKIKSGIYLPDEKWNRMCIVLSSKSDELKSGDIILKDLGKSTKMKLNDIPMEMIHINSIMCIIKKY